MGRPRLYHTPEEKAAANQAKSKRHHDENKNVINVKRRNKYHKHKLKQANDQKSPVDRGTLVLPAQSSNQNQKWMEHANRVFARMNRITLNNPTGFMEQACLAFLTDEDIDSVHEHVVKLGKCQKSIYKYQNEIYALGGMTQDYHTVDKLVKEICRVVSWIEELLCYAMVDVAEVGRMHQGHNFEYQKYTG